MIQVYTVIYKKTSPGSTPPTIFSFKMTSSSLSTTGLSTPPPTIEFHPPTHVAGNGTIIESNKEPITISDPSEWIIRVQSCIAKMEEDLGHWGSLSTSTKAQTIQAYNALADKLDEVYDILKANEADVDRQVRSRYVDIINSSGKFSADLYMNLANAKRRAGEKLEMLAVLQQRQQETATAFERFVSSYDKGKEAAHATATATASTATVNAGGTWGESAPTERFLEELRPLLLAKKETACRPAMKVPDTFDGTYSKLRSWWELVKDYMEIHEPTMPTESIQIKFVGSLLRDEARRWYDTRKRTMEVRHDEDRWETFSKALLARFTDRQEKRRDYDKLKALRYEGSIQDYLSRLEELNSRVGVSGPALQDIILRQMTPEMGRAIFHKAGAILESDDALIDAVREAGIIEEEILRTQGRMKGSTQRKPVDATSNPTQSNTQTGGKKSEKDGRARRPRKADGTSTPQQEEGAKKENPEKKDFSHLTKLWDNPKAAFQGVSFEETKKHKDMGRDCHRCGNNGHHSVHCRAGKTVGGTELPPYPGKKDATTAATKRKRTEDENSDEQPPAQKGKTAAVIASASQPPIWALSDDELSDF